MKKLLSILLVAVLLLSLSATVFASSEPEPNLIVRNATLGKAYNYYQLFTADSYAGSGETPTITYFTTAAKKGIINGDDTCPFAVSNIAQPGKAINATGLPTDGYAVSLKEGKTATDVNTWLNKEVSGQKNYELISLRNGFMTVNGGIATATVSSGYYYVTTTLGATVTIDTVFDSGATTIYDKNDAVPDGPFQYITKEGTEQFNTTLPSENYPGYIENDAAVDEVEEITVHFNAVNYRYLDLDLDDDESTPAVRTPVKVTSWTMVETPTNLDVDKDSVQVYVRNTKLSEGEDFTTTKNADGSVTVTIDWIDDDGSHLFAASTAGDARIPVKVTYNAKVLPDAATTPAPTNVAVTYAYDPVDTPASDPANDDLGTDSTTTYTYGFELVKTDAESKSLLGAEFELGVSVDDDGIAETEPVWMPFSFIQTVVNNSSGTADHYVYRLATREEVTGGLSTNTIALTVANRAEIRGLDNETYLLKETKAPDGYNVLTGEVEVKPAEESGVLTKIEAAGTDLADHTVVNQAGDELPETGGVGTTLFYIFGAILFLGAGAILIARRKVADR